MFLIISGRDVTLTFDLLTPQPNQFILTQDAVLTKAGEKSINAYYRYRGNTSWRRIPLAPSNGGGQRHKNIKF